MKRKRISIVVPVYFNEGSLPALFRELDALEKGLRKRTLGLETIFVDDGSRDRSLDLLIAYKKKRPGRTKVVQLTRNFGAVHCSKTGLRFVTGDAFLVVAADLQDPPSLILDMVDRWRRGAKFVICERLTRKDPLVSRIFSWFYYFCLRTLIIRDYPRGGYDMALMDRSLIGPLINSSKSMFTPLLAYWLGYVPEVITYHRPARVHGRSRWTLAKRVGAFFDVMLGFSVTPIRLISAAGILVALLSFGYGTSVILNALMGHVPVRGFAALAALTSFLFGTTILMLGIIGEYLWRIFEEVNHRPETVIEKVH